MDQMEQKKINHCRRCGNAGEVTCPSDRREREREGGRNEEGLSEREGRANERSGEIETNRNP